MAVYRAGYKTQWDVLGDKALIRVLDILPKEINKEKALFPAFRFGVKPLIQRARQLARKSKKRAFMKAYRDFSKKSGQTTRIQYHTPGQLQRSIGTAIGKVRLRGVRPFYVGPLRGNDQRDDGWYAHFVEFGTKGYTLKKGKYLNGYYLPKGTYIKGQKPSPFLRPALDQTADVVLMRVLKKLERQVQKLVIKHRGNG